MNDQDKKKKKIKLMVVTPYFPPSIGGVQNYSYNISKGLMKDYNYEIIVITSNHKNPREYKEEILEGMKIYRLPRQFKLSNTPISFKWKRQIKEIIETEKPDVINAHAPVPFISDIVCRIAYEKEIHFILTYHSGSMIKKKAPIKNIIIFLYESTVLKKTFKKTFKIICSSDFVKLNFLKKFKGKSVTIVPGVDTNLFMPKKYFYKNIIAYVGRIDKASKWKGINYLIDSIILIKDKIPYILLNLIGEGNAVKGYKQQVKKLGLNNQVNFLGSLIGNNLVKEYNNSNLIVLPSISEAESFGMVLIEAMACKKPVIGSNIGGIPYVIDDGVNGSLVPPKDPQALANAIIKILENPKLAKKMGESGYKKVKENFTWSCSIKNTDKLLRNSLR